MLRGQVAVISGGLGDIGRAIARTLAHAGADIALSDLHAPEAGADFCAELTQLGVKARYERVDVSDARAVKAWLRGVEASLGLPTLIVPNAAIVSVTTGLALTEETWSRELRVNLDGAFFLAQAAAQRLVEQKRAGRIVFIGSWAGHSPHPHITAYSVSKAALRMLMKCLAHELAPHGVLVNEVAPGYVDAGLSGRFFSADPAVRADAQSRVPIQALIESDDVARQVVHLCDPQNRHMTGSVLLMDGGLSLVSAGNSKAPLQLEGKRA